MADGADESFGGISRISDTSAKLQTAGVEKQKLPDQGGAADIKRVAGIKRIRIGVPVWNIVAALIVHQPTLRNKASS